MLMVLERFFFKMFIHLSGLLGETWGLFDGFFDGFLFDGYLV